MKSFLLPISNGSSLRIYGKESDPNIVYNASGIKEYVVLEAQEIKAGSIYSWVIKEDLEVITAWFVNQYNSNPIPPESQINITVYNTSNDPVFSLYLLFSQLTNIGSVSYYDFPPGTLIRKGNRLNLLFDSDSNGCNIILNNCNILESIAPTVLGVNTSPT